MEPSTSTTHTTGPHVTGTYGAPYPLRRESNTVHLTGRSPRDLPAMMRAWRSLAPLPPLSR